MHGRPMPSCGVRPSVRLSVTFVYCIEFAKILELFSPSEYSLAMQFCVYRMLRQYMYSDRELPYIGNIECRFFFQSVLVSSIVAFLQAVARPKFRGPRSASIARSHCKSSCWSLPVGRYLSDTRCKDSMVVLAR